MLTFSLNKILKLANHDWFKMVKYLSQGHCLTVFLLALLTTIALSSRAPVPTCSSPRIAFQDFPISLHQTQSANMDEIFSGYNLNITIPSKPPFVTLRPRLTKRVNSETPQPGLRNYHFSHMGNQWGNLLVTLSVEGNNTIVRWGASNDRTNIPNLSNNVTVENDSKVQCYDAVWFRAEMLILVDCVQNASTLGFGLVNYFYYINSTTKATLGKVKNDMYVTFTQISRRKIMLLTEDNYHYLIRAYFAQYVDELHRENTYVEILSVNNPMKPWTIRVMDRSFLHQKKLSITDFEVYLGDIYILDYFSGVIKFDISRQQTIVIVGRYRTDSGYTKFGVYSNNLDNQFLIVLAHNHTIMQIDWTNQIKPQIVTKYSIPDDSHIHDLWVNEQYVVVQLTANLTNGTQTTRYQSTYVLTRGSRTYLNAFVAIPHSTPQAFVDLQRDTNQILTIDTDRLSIYQLGSSRVNISPTSEDLLNKEFSFVVKAQSTNQYNPNSTLVCTFTFKYIVVNLTSLALWPTGRTLPTDYYANYPGQLFIPIDRYVFGANITYGILPNKSQTPPTNYFLQQNQTVITWRGKPHSIFKYNFIRTQQFDSNQDTQINVYTQDVNKSTYFSRCGTIPYTKDVHCFENTNAPDINDRIVNLTASRFHYYQGRYVHLAAIVYDTFPNEVFVYHVQQGVSMTIPPIMFPQGLQGKIQNIEFLGHYLVVVLRYVKQIVFFDMVECQDHLPNSCRQIYRINSTTLSRIGVDYFSPMDIYTTGYHPFALFIQCLDQVLILDITRRGPILLGKLKSPGSQEPGFYKWKMAIAKGELILVNPPNIIEEHDLDQLYTIGGEIPYTRSYPTYGYQIQDKFDLDYSDSGNLVYITAIDKALPEGQNSVIMVYRSGYPAVSSFYDVFHLNAKYQDLMIDASGSFGDYVAVVYNNIFMMFRQYEIPILVFEDVFGDFDFNLTYTNEPHGHYYYLSKSAIHTANYPQDIVINNTDLNKTDFLSATVNSTDTATHYFLDDATWFNGSVLNYTLEGCDQCNKKISVVNHLNEERVLMGIHDMQDYVFTLDGGYIQQYQNIIKMRHNGSINQFVSLPSTLDGQNCLYIEHSWIYDYTLSACKNADNGGEVYLYTTVHTASKPFVNGPYYSSAKHVVSVHVMEQLMILVDVDENPFSFDREGGVIIYAMNHDPFEPQIFDQLQFIDSDDLTAANDWPGGSCYIGNAHFAFTNMTNTYRLIITELRKGFFVVDFKWVKNRKSVQILKIEFIDLAELLTKLHLPLPNLAFFTAVAINKQFYDARLNNWDTEVIVTTSNFHSFLVNLRIDKTGTVVSHEIIRVFYRYGFYESQNYIKAFDGYFALGQRLPTMLHVFPWYSKLVLSIYDTRQRWVINQTTGQKAKSERYLQGTNVPVSFMLGGYTMNEGSVTFDWNFTFVRNSTDPFRRIGLLALHNYDARIWELSVHEKFIIRSSVGITATQSGSLVARNDFHNIKVPIKLIVNSISDSSGLAGWAIALITIGSLAGAAAIGFLVYIKFFKGKTPNRESETEKSLLERQGENDSKSDEEGDQDDEQGDEEDEEEEEQEVKEVAKGASTTQANGTQVKPLVNDTTINRQSEVQNENPVEEPKKEE